MRFDKICYNKNIMKTSTTIAVVLALLALLGFGYYFFMYSSVPKGESARPAPTPIIAEPTPTASAVAPSKTAIGTSAGKREIMAYHYGTGEKELLFIGGIHGGYEWNTALVSFELIDYLEANRSSIPKNLKITVIPVVNPDGLYKVVGSTGRFDASKVPAEAATIPGRYNDNGVDINRNFDCDWQKTAVWKTTKVNPGSGVFSEPESNAIKDYVLAQKPAAVVVWYSSYGGVFASNCHKGILPETAAITKVYADASGYKAYNEYNFYEITGDMVNWLAKNNIPGISVLLTDHKNTEWEKNINGIKALFDRYSK